MPGCHGDRSADMNAVMDLIHNYKSEALLADDCVIRVKSSLKLLSKPCVGKCLVRLLFITS